MPMLFLLPAQANVRTRAGLGVGDRDLPTGPRLMPVSILLHHAITVPHTQSHCSPCFPPSLLSAWGQVLAPALPASPNCNHALLSPIRAASTPLYLALSHPTQPQGSRSP
jgi:hypothetical protein